MEVDDFEQEYGDDLDALLELEEEVGADFSPFSTKTKKSLNFSTPSTKHVSKTQNKRGNVLRLESDDHDNSVLNDSFPTPLPETSPVVAKEQILSQKRRQDEMFGVISDSEEEAEEEDLPSIVHKKKRARLEVNGNPDFEDDFEITPPPSPGVGRFGGRLQKQMPIISSLSDYQDRVTEHYDLERPRVLRRRPVNQDFLKVTDSDGQRVYMTVKDELTFSREVEKLSSGKQQLDLLGVSLDVLRAQVDDKRTKRVMEESKRLTQLVNREVDDDDGDTEDLGEDGDESLEQVLWVERYSPQRYTELLSDEATNRLVLKWLKQWDYVVFGKENKPRKSSNIIETKEKNLKTEKSKPFFKKNVPEVTDELDQHNRPMHKVALLCGPPGLGKTTLAHVIANHAGYCVVEMNASDDRSVEIFKTKIEAATQMKAVLGKDPRPNCLIIDEIDGAPLPAINMLLSMVKGPDVGATNTTKKKKKKGGLLLRPIICICNDLYVPALRQLRQLALVINFPPTAPSKLASRLHQISQREQLKSDLTTLLALCEKADNDIRSCLNTLQFVRSRSRELTLSVVNSTSVGQKDAHKSLFNVWQNIFSLPKLQRKRYINPHDRSGVSLSELEEMSAALNQNNTTPAARFQTTLHLAQAAGETEKVMQGLFENYLESKVKDPRMETVYVASEWMCFVDRINQDVLHNQSYILWRYTSYLPVAFHLLFASTHHPRINYPHSQFEAQSKLNKLQQLVDAMLCDVAPSVRKNLNMGVAVMELLPHLLEIIQPNLRPVNTQLYSQREKQELAHLIHVMIAYNLSYRQERSLDGQYTYNLEPFLDELAHYSGLKQHKQLTYAAKQLIAREIELEKLRRTEAPVRPDPRPVAPPNVSVKNLEKAAKDGDRNEDQLPNYKRQTLEPLALKATADSKEGRVKPVRDFFGRMINVKKVDQNTDTATSGKTKKDAKREIIGGDIWFRFKEGFTNAVRRTVRVSDLL